jgi:hypothetical protein
MCIAIFFSEEISTNPFLYYAKVVVIVLNGIAIVVMSLAIKKGKFR